MKDTPFTAKNIGLIILFILLPAVLFAQQAVGEVVFLDGDVEVHRNGKALDWKLVDIGLTIESYDLLETDKGAIAEVQVTVPHSGGAFIRVRENTAFYFDLKEVGGKKQTNFQMLSGSLVLRVKQLTGAGEVVVRTESAVMGVRGTEFMVTTAVEGSILITCTEGAVSCTDSQGRELYARPGQGVEQLSDSTSRSVALDPKQIDSFRNSWLQTREEVFKSGADVFIRTYALRYLDALPKFQVNYRDLVKHYDLLRNTVDRGSGSSQGTLIQVKKEVSPAVFAMRSMFPLFEHTFYRLTELETYHRQGIGQGLIKRNYNSDQFFREFSREREQLRNQMAIVRHMFKLFVRLDEALGGDSLMGDIFGSGPLSPIGPPGGGMDNF